MKKELEVAIKFLEARSTESKKSDPARFVRSPSWLSVSEVRSVLTMVADGSFRDWYLKNQKANPNMPEFQFELK